jgi:hypothetical protein
MSDLQSQLVGAAQVIVTNGEYGTAYAASTVRDTTRVEFVTLFVTNGATNGRIRFEFSPNNVTYFPAGEISTTAAGTVVASTQNLTASVSYRFRIPVTDNFFRVAYQRSEATTGGTLTISLVDGV